MRLFLSLLFALPLWILAQEPQNALLWRISPSGGGSPSYLLGTVHSRDARAYAVITLAQAAMEATSAVFGELDMQATAKAKSSMAAHAMMAGGQSLKDLYPAGKYKRVEKALREKVGPLFMMLTHLKPILLSAMLTEESMGKDSAQVLDEYLQVRAREMGKRAGGIETIAEQLAAMDRIPLRDQADMLYETVRDKSGAKEMDRLLNAYAKQDLTTIGELMKDGGMSDAFYGPLLSERNVVMAHRIDSLLKMAPTLFAIGAAHLPGEGGVLALLLAKGLQASPVNDEGMIGPPLPVPDRELRPATEEEPPPPTDTELERIESLPRPSAPPILPK